MDAPKTTSRSYPHSLEERAAAGKAARSVVSRSALAAWEPPANRPNPVDLLEAQAVTRLPELIPIRYGRMLASPFAFYRGAATIMACDLASQPNTGLHVQLCGDAHLSNFGGFASPERELILDINDFDETLPGPWEWDLKRLAASVEIACRDRGFDIKTRRRLVLGTMGEYHQAMSEFAGMGNLELWYLHLSPAAVETRWGMSAKPKAIKILEAEFSQAHHRDNLRAFEKLTHSVEGQLRIVAHPPLVIPVEDLIPSMEQAQFEKTMASSSRGTGPRCNLTAVTCLRDFDMFTSRARWWALGASGHAPGLYFFWAGTSAIPYSYKSRKPRLRCWNPTCPKAAIRITVSGWSPGRS